MNFYIDSSSDNYSYDDFFGISDLYENIEINHTNMFDDSLIEKPFGESPIDSDDSYSIAYNSDSDLPFREELSEYMSLPPNTEDREVNEPDNRIIESKQHILPTEYSNQDEKLNKRKRKCCSSAVYSSMKKKQRSCAGIDSKFPNGEDLDKNMVLKNEDIEKYKQLENIFRKCSVCENNITLLKVFKTDEGFICDNCAKNNRIDLEQLKKDLFEEFDYSGVKLYKCCRLKHARPLYHFIKYINKRDSYEVVTNCAYCRLFKYQEYHLKINP